MLTALGLGRDAAVGVETTERTVALVEDTATLFDEGLDIVDEFLFVELIAGCAIGLLNVLD